MARFFFYGTLLDADVQSLVFGRALAESAVCTAVLENVRTAQTRARLYPVLARREGARTAGVLVSGLTDADVARLIYYEGDGYAMREVAVAVGPGPMKDAWTFVPVRRLAALPSNWSLADWQRRLKPREIPAIAAMMRAFPGPGRLAAFRIWRARRRRPRAV